MDKKGQSLIIKIRKKNNVERFYLENRDSDFYKYFTIPATYFVKT